MTLLLNLHVNVAYMLGNNLLNHNSKFKKMGIAHRVFDEMLVRKTITLITLMKGI
jgi:hypothetical protein